jgi:hypothetical protein
MGSTGPAGPAGPQGPQGQMSAPVDVVSGQSYAEGTIGLWGNGVWYARGQTRGTPEEDTFWKLMVDGIRDFIVERTEKGCRLELMLSSGDVRGFELALPRVEHLGAWEAGRQYLELQEVAWNGATWRALRDTQSEPPGEDWRLVSQRGKSGPRGEQGPAGPQGVPGADGRGVGHIGWEGKGFAVTMTDGTVFPVVPEGLGDE